MARAALRLSVREVAIRLAMSYPNITKIEAGKSNPRTVTIAKLTAFYQAAGVEFSEDGWVRLQGYGSGGFRNIVRKAPLRAP